MPDPTPRSIVSDKCIAYTEALLQYRRAVLTDEEATEEGRNLFTWFEGIGALTDDNAPIASRSVDLGITLLKTSIGTVDFITGQIEDSYTHFVGG